MTAQQIVEVAKRASIAVDLDGTLAKHSPGKFDRSVIGDPVPRMLSRVKRWLKDGEEVKIFTARAADPKNIPPVRKWLKAHGLSGCAITNEKTPDIEELWDDRAVGVERDTGKVKSAGGFGTARRIVNETLRYLKARNIALRRGPGFLSYYRHMFDQPGVIQVGRVNNPVYMLAHEVGHAKHFVADPKLMDASLMRKRFPLAGKSEDLVNFAHELRNEHIANSFGRRLVPGDSRNDYRRAMSFGLKAHKMMGLHTALFGSGSGSVGGPFRKIHYLANRAARRRLPMDVLHSGQFLPDDQFLTELKSIRRHVLGKNPTAALVFREAHQQPRLRYLLQKPASAKGIPSRKNYGDLAQLQPGDLLDYIIQQHDAEVAGPHKDLRMGSPELGLFSWASRKGVPGVGEKTLAVRQPLHSYGYRKFEGRIPSGRYGGGLVRKEREGKLLITRVSDQAIHFTEGSTGKRFTLFKPKGADQNWLLSQTASPERPDIEKQHYVKIPPAKADAMLKQLMEEGSVAQPKVDGALAYVRLAKHRAEIVSHRKSKRTGKAIVHTERVLGKLPDVDYPASLEGSTLLGEIFGERGGKAIPPQELGGLLNMGVAKSRQAQQDRDIRLKTLLFGVGQTRGRGRPFSKDYATQRALLEEAVKVLPAEHFVLPEEATTYEDAVRLLEQIQSGTHPLTREGLVLHPRSGGVPHKLKFRPERKVFVRSVYPGEGKYEGKGAGGFEYSSTPKGQVIGRVGTGLRDALRREMWANPEQFIGRVARVAAQESFPSGALRAPSLIALHEG